MRSSLLSISLVLLCAAMVSAQQQPETDGDGEREMLETINALREEADLAPLARHEGLDQAALVHSADMAAHHQLTHVSERTGDPASRVQAAGVVTTRVAENIARHRATAGAMRSILASEPHRRQLVDGQYTHVGLAAVVGDDGIYVTQVLAVLVPPPAPDEDEALPPPAVSDIAPPATSAGTAQAVAPAPGQPEVMPTMRMPASRGRVAGYWLFSGNRWWFFPVPPGAAVGQLLQPDPNMMGPPPGYNGLSPPPPTAPRSPTAYGMQPQPTSTGYRSPRRRGTIYWY